MILISDIQAEAGIIATLIYNPSFIFHSEQLKHNYFNDKENCCLYWGIQQLVKKGVDKIDTINLTTVINSNEGMRNTFDKFGIDLEEYISLAENVARNTIEEYKVLVERVIALAFKRSLNMELTKIIKQCKDVDDDNIGRLNSEIYETLNKLNEKYILFDDDIKFIGEELDDIWNEIVEDSQNEEMTLKPKIKRLRNYFTYGKGEVIMLAARYKQGKSAVLMNECLYQAQQGHSVLYLDSEMKKKEFVLRCMANLSQVDYKKIKNGTYSASEEVILKEALKEFKQLKIIHKYKPDWRNEDIFSTVKIVQNRNGLDFLIFDYIKSNSGDANTIYNKLGEKADYIKNIIAGQLDIPVLTASQLNRQGEISDSDKLARYVSTVVFWRQKKTSELDGKNWREAGNATMQIRVNRLGEQMQDDEFIHCVFEGNKMTVTEAPEQEEQNVELIL